MQTPFKLSALVIACSLALSACSSSSDGNTSDKTNNVNSSSVVIPPSNPLKAEEPKAEEPKAEEPKAEEPKAEEPKAEEPKAEEPKAEEPKVEEPIHFVYTAQEQESVDKAVDTARNANSKTDSAFIASFQATKAVTRANETLTAANAENETAKNTATAETASDNDKQAYLNKATAYAMAATESLTAAQAAVEKTQEAVTAAEAANTSVAQALAQAEDLLKKAQADSEKITTDANITEEQKTQVAENLKAAELAYERAKYIQKEVADNLELAKKDKESVANAISEAQKAVDAATAEKAAAEELNKNIVVTPSTPNESPKNDTKTVYLDKAADYNKITIDGVDIDLASVKTDITTGNPHYVRSVFAADKASIGYHSSDFSETSVISSQVYGLQHVVAGAAKVGDAQYLFVQGEKTKAPTAGSATYEGGILRFAQANADNLFQEEGVATGKFDATIDFANKTISGQIRDHGWGGEDQPFSGTVTSDGFNATWTDSDSGSGLNGHFYGADAAEVGGDFKRSDSFGVFVGKKASPEEE
ncbi:transferrin-binding protein-like solute binding protein [Lonepinella sp. BR2474]|uniref:transferrin-binding protein-like solute binding protein n=1 Tax=Lonepinella sp. BR2474 TaxID=3434548 RepID=UPI003F6E02FC